MAKVLLLVACSLMTFLLYAELTKAQVIFCFHPPGYDLDNLTMPNTIWEFNREGQCINDSNKTNECTFSFALCHQLPNDADCVDSSVCQVSSESTKTELGHFSMHPFTSKQENGFYATFKRSEPVVNPITKNLCNLSVVLEFVCDKDVPWIRTDGVNQAPDPILYTPITAELCEIQVRFPYAGACGKSPTTLNTTTVKVNTTTVMTTTIISTTTTAPKKSASAGTVLTIIFFVFLGSYLIIGCLYNKFIAKEKGLFIIPHIRVWSAVLLYTIDGMKITWEFITCQKKREYKTIESTYQEVE